MGAPELLALSLGLSVVVAALGWAGGRLVERLSADPRLRDRVWALALILPALPPLAVGLMLLAPAPVLEIAPPPAGLPAGLPAAPAEVFSAPPPAGLAFDPTLAAWIVLGVTILLAVARLAALAVRARRLLRIIGQTRTPTPAVIAMVEEAARALAIRPPLVRISPSAPEALLASLGRPRLILPAGLIAPSADPAATRAVIAHELAHLKRGDHRALWLEESLLALLAVNPLMPMLRARRAAAREEACDALALAGAAPDARRAYARSLIEALRDRAGPRASGGLPALTFTGAGRTTAMTRLKAVLSPAPAAGRGPRLMAVGLAGLIAMLTGAGSLAVAAEREAIVRVQPVAVLDEQPRTVDMGAGARELLNGEPLPEGLPVWALAPERIDVRTTGDGPGTVNFILPFTGSTPVSVNGRRMPEGFPVSGVNGDAVARVDVVGGHVRYTLKPEAEVRRVRRDAEAEAEAEAGRSAAIIAADTASNSLTPEQQARYRNATAQQYQALCASSDPGDEGFCAGVIFAQLGGGICPSPSLEQGDETARRAALGAVVERGKAEIARSTVRPGDTPGSLARAALSRAYPCDAAALQTTEPAAPRGAMARPLDQVHAAALGDAGGVVGESVLLTLDIDLAPGVRTTPEGTLMVRIQPTGNRPRTRLQFAVGGDFDPIPMGVAVKGSAATPEDYVITAEIRDGDGRVLFATSAPVQVTASARPVRAALILEPAS